MGIIGKISILIIPIFFSHIVTQAQVYRFDCFEYAEYPYVHTGDTNWIEVKYPATVDFEKKTVELKSKPPQDFVITGFDPLRIDKNGNTIVCNAIDSEGNRCNVELTLFRERSFHVATLVIRYSTLIHSHRLKNIKK